MTTKIAFLGLGAMGTRMATNLTKDGFEVTVWNRTVERTNALVELGAARAETPADAAATADIVMSMVRDDAASTEVWLGEGSGALHAMRKDAIGIECSTLTVDHVRGLADRAAAHGVHFLDSPLAGSRPQAEAGQLIFLVGGDAAALESARPALDAMGSAVHHAGTAGAGATVKLAVNALLGIQAATMAELIGMFEKNGIDPANAVEILGAIPVTSPAAKATAGMMLAGAFDPMFPIELMEKDFGYIQAAGTQMPISRATRDVLQNAIADGFGGDNFPAIIKVFRREADTAAA